MPRNPNRHYCAICQTHGNHHTHQHPEPNQNTTQTPPPGQHT